MTEESALKRYAGACCKYARRHVAIGGCYGVEFDDLLIAAKLGVVKACRTYRGDNGATFGTWVIYCIRHALHEFTRAFAGTMNRDRRPIEVSGDVMDAIGAWMPAPGNQFASVENRLCVEQALRRAELLASEKEVIGMLAGGAVYRDIAQHRGCSITNVARMANRGRKRLAAVMR